ncbi:MAG TPA: serine--tRNA ligase [Fimbriiglobus sp.]|jgi:seryl-tRNA synthetase|nr:serine--tRNA ligase [Fimbriiglobus sp.]
MLDAAYVRDNIDAVRQNCANRAARNAEVDRVVALDDERKRLQKQADELRARGNEVAKRTGATKEKADRDALIAEGRQIKEQVAALEKQVNEVEQNLRLALVTIPNMTHPDAPVGDENRIVRTSGTPAKYDFKPKDHVDLVTALDLADLEAGTKVAGQKFYFLKNEGALLEIALVQYALTILVRHGFTPVITPDLARVEVMEGTGYMPRNDDPTKREFYQIADSDLCLIATAEITIGGMHKDDLLDEARLPLKYAGLSHCFRTEAGAAGRDTRGLYRVHQFTKVEMFAFCTPEQSDAIHEELLQIQEEIFQGLGLPYQVIDTCTADLGGPAYRKYDLEAWMPGRGQGGEFGEVTSTSNCTDYQARRLGIRYRPKEKKGTRFVHTLNGTAVACTRALVAILENYQQADGTVRVPDVLRPWVGKDVIAPKS